MKRFYALCMFITTFCLSGCTEAPCETTGAVKQALVGTPMTPKLYEADFDSAAASTYHSGNKLFIFGGVNYVFSLVADSGGHGTGKWEFVAVSSLSTGSAWYVDQSTADIIINGLYDSTNLRIDYNSKSWRIRAVRNTTDGLNRAEAYCVANC